jgi:hypothetical protein
VVLEGSGHWPMLDDPAALEQVVLPFVAAAVGARRTDPCPPVGAIAPRTGAAFRNPAARS